MFRRKKIELRLSHIDKQEAQEDRREADKSYGEAQAQAQRARLKAAELKLLNERNGFTEAILASIQEKS